MIHATMNMATGVPMKIRRLTAMRLLYRKVAGRSSVSKVGSGPRVCCWIPDDGKRAESVLLEGETARRGNS